MIPSYWYSSPVAFLWQAALHSVLAAGLFYAWSRQLDLRSGPVKRCILCLLLTLPLLTAAVPGRSGFDFREDTAWLDSSRILAVPLIAGMQVYHVVLVLAVLTVAASLWQEVMPVFRRAAIDALPAPDPLVQRARQEPHWEHCHVQLIPTDHVFLATAGWPGRPRLLVSEGALRQLPNEEMDAALRHENAHWRNGRWVLTHALFAIRMAQCYNPVALWAFREFAIEIEVRCDADAVAGRDPKPLVRALMKIYEATDPRERAVRSTLRKRVDALLGTEEPAPGDPPAPAVVVAAVLLTCMLPWIV